MKQQEVKTTLMLPVEVHKRLKRRAIDEGRPVKEIVLEAIGLYLAGKAFSKTTQKEGRTIVKLMNESVEGAGPEDFLEYDLSDTVQHHSLLPFFVMFFLQISFERRI